MAAFPSVGIQSMTMRLVSAVGMSESPFTFDQQVYQHQGVRWEAEVSLPPLTRNEAKQMEAFFAALRGRSGTFTMGNPLHNTTAVGTITEASKGATTITASVTNATAGDYFQANDRLYIITDIGASTIDVMPPMRDAVSGSLSMDFTYPVGTWRLASNSIEWSINEASLYGFSFACVEAL